MYVHPFSLLLLEVSCETWDSSQKGNPSRPLGNWKFQGGEVSSRGLVGLKASLRDGE